VKSYDRIITVSESEKNYLVKYLGYPAELFSVTYLGAHERFKVRNDQGKLLDIKNKYSLPDKFLFFAGKIDPIKNVDSMIKAFCQVKRKVDT